MPNLNPACTLSFTKDDAVNLAALEGSLQPGFEQPYGTEPWDFLSAKPPRGRHLPAALGEAVSTSRHGSATFLPPSPPPACLCLAYMDRVALSFREGWKQGRLSKSRLIPHTGTDNYVSSIAAIIGK